MNKQQLERKVNFVSSTIISTLRKSPVSNETLNDFENVLKNLLMESFEDCIDVSPVDLIDQALKGDPVEPEKES